MRLHPEQTGQHLQQTLLPVYLIAGDEPLLVQETADAIRSAARARGFADRELFHVDDKSFAWHQLLNEASHLSLFAQKKILELRLPSGKIGADGSLALQEYCAHPSDDNLLLIISTKMDSATLKSKWAKTLDASGAIVQVWPVTAQQMPRWIEQRLKQAGIRANAAAREILTHRVEGNLLAAVQEIEKLKLLVTGDVVDATTMSTVVADSARYNVFALVDTMLEGDAAAACRQLRGLREEGTDATAILWAITRELRTLNKACDAASGGERSDWALKKMGIWEKRQPLVRGALRRLTSTQLTRMLRQAAGIDRAIKGMRSASPWDELCTLVLSVCGVNTLNLRSLGLTLRE